MYLPPCAVERSVICDVAFSAILTYGPLVVSDKTRLKSISSATETRYKIEI